MTAMWQERLARGARLEDAISAATLLRPSFAGLVNEELRVIFLDAHLCPLKLIAEPGTSPCSVNVPIRRIMADALAIDARALILAHNHPAGDPSPSAADKAVTRRLAEVAGPLGVRLVDHLVFGGERVASFRALGLL